jgi:DNA polymerase-4
MAGFQAKKLCPELVFLPVRFELYRKVSKELRELLIDFAKCEFDMSSEIEMASIDECYFEINAEPDEAWQIGQRLRDRIKQQLGVTASLGIAPNKMLSKIISSLHKPNKQFLLRESDVEAFMQTLPVSAIPGVGPKASERLKARNILTCGELQKLSMEELSSSFGPSWGWALHDKCRGRDARRLQTRRERKSFSCERTLFQDLYNQEELDKHLEGLWKEFLRRFENQASKKLSMAKCYVTLRFSDFKRTTKERSALVLNFDVYKELAHEAFDRSRKGVRLIGMGIRFESAASRKPSDPRQLDLFQITSKHV